MALLFNDDSLRHTVYDLGDVAECYRITYFQILFVLACMVIYTVWMLIRPFFYKRIVLLFQHTDGIRHFRMPGSVPFPLIVVLDV